MRPWWDRSGQAGAELEALQTDVMRFMAILGLCLAAIFSLLRSAEVARVNPEAAEVEPVLEPAPVAPPSPEPAQQAQSVEAVETPPPSLPATAPPQAPEEEGFTLEFESSIAMSRLLDGGLVGIYLIDGDRYYSYRGEAGFAVVAPPASYYAMQAETVPVRLRNLAEGIQPGVDASWGVSLPAATERQLQALMATHRGGGLVIDGEGAVRIE